MFVHHVNSKTAATLLILVLALSVSSLAGAGPEYYNENAGISSNMFPFGAPDGKEVNWLFLAGELAKPMPLPAGNMITDVYFLCSLGYAGSKTYTDLTIKMAQDTITTLTSGQFYPGPWTTVYYRASVPLNWALGQWTGPIALDTPFPYDPTKSLILDVEQSGISSWAGDAYVLAQTMLTGTRRVWSVDGPPFTPYGSGDGAIVNFGVDITPIGVIPAPGAVVLGMVGTGLVGWLRRRRTI